MIEQYSVPTSIDEATRVMHDCNVTVLAGGTDLMPQTASGKRRFETTLLNIRRVDGMSGIAIDSGLVRIGALTTITEILENEKIAEFVPVLAQTADRFASPQLRNAATIGGNLCNASPAGDMIIPLLLLDADVELARWSGESLLTRRLPVAKFFARPGETCKRDDELLTAIQFAVPQTCFVAYFCKSGPRPALEISTVSIGIAGILQDESLHAARVAIGAAGPTPLRARGVEAVLDGKYLDSKLIAEAADAVTDDAIPINDVRASAWYRKHLLKVFTRRILNDVASSCH